MMAGLANFPLKAPSDGMTQSVAEHRTHSQAGCDGMAIRPGCSGAAVGEPTADGGVTAGGRAVGAGLGTALVLWCLLARGAMPKVQLPEEPESITFNVSEFSHTEISYREEDCVLKSVTSDWLDFLFFCIVQYVLLI